MVATRICPLAANRSFTVMNAQSGEFEVRLNCGSHVPGVWGQCRCAARCAHRGWPDVNLRRAFCAAQLAFGCATSTVVCAQSATAT